MEENDAYYRVHKKFAVLSQTDCKMGLQLYIKKRIIGIYGTKGGKNYDV